MTKITQTKLARAITRLGHDSKGKKVPRIVGYEHAQKREKMTCKCGRSKLLSVGQIWVCKHKD